jgi:hypothetical protein
MKKLDCSLVSALVLVAACAMACAAQTEDGERAAQSGDAGVCVPESAHELCHDGVDNNCNGAIDEGCVPGCAMESTKELCWDGVERVSAGW